MPSFAHVSLILAPDRSKLSKRHGATSVGQVLGPNNHMKPYIIRNLQYFQCPVLFLGRRVATLFSFYYVSIGSSGKWDICLRQW